MSTYNGWTNYATWRINLELFDGYDPDGIAVTHESIKALADDWVFEFETMNDSRSHRLLMVDYAAAFMADVNWHEIANGINEAYELSTKTT